MSRPKTLSLKRLRGAWAKGFNSLPTLDGDRHRTDEKPFQPLPLGAPETFDVTEDDVGHLARVLQDEALAKRIKHMQTDNYPYGTLPEMLMMDFLDTKHERYVYQAQIAGGHRGGLVPDFALQKAGGWRALLIQGQYWHNVPGKAVKDESDRLRLIGSIYNGQPIMDVVFVWERRLMQSNPGRDVVLQNALAGIEQGQ